MSATDTPDFRAQVCTILSDLRRDQEANIVLHRDADLCKHDVETRSGTGSLALQKLHQAELEFQMRHRGHYLLAMDACLDTRCVECDALTARHAVDDADHDANMLERIELLSMLKRRWSYMQESMSVHINTEKERIKNEKVNAERFNETLYAAYTNKVETAGIEYKRLEADVAAAWAVVKEAGRRLEKRRRIAVDMAIDKAEFGATTETEAVSTAEFNAMPINTTLNADCFSLVRRARKLQDMLHVMQRNVTSFARRDKRGLYKNIVYTNGRYRWRFFHLNRMYSSRGSFHTIEEAMMSLIDDKSDKMV